MISGQTHCRNGHLYTPQTTKWRKGTRICLICSAVRQAKVKEARKRKNQTSCAGRLSEENALVSRSKSTKNRAFLAREVGFVAEDRFAWVCIVGRF
jgi:hypothetical protein